MNAKFSPGGGWLKKLSIGQLFIILAVVSALLTIFIFKSLISGKSPVTVKANLKTRHVVVATEALLPGEVITSKTVKVVDWPADHMPQSDVYDSTSKLIGRAVKDQIFAGSPVFRLNLSGESSTGGLPVVIPSGYRALTILVTEDKGVGGFIRPGDHVDVLGNFEVHIPEETQKAMSSQTGGLLEDTLHTTQTVLQDVEVLAIAQDMYEKKGLERDLDPTQAPSESKDPKDKDASTKGKVVSSVTLAVSPEQAEKLSYADSRGVLRLALRPENEHEQIDLLGALGEDVIPLQTIYQKMIQAAAMMPVSMAPPPAADVASSPTAPPPVLPPRPAGRQVELIEGTEASTVSF